MLFFHNFTDSFKIQTKEWFNDECKNAKRSYMHALKHYKLQKTDLSRCGCCHYKKENKRLVKSLRNSYYNRKMSDIEDLRLSSPKDFWNFSKRLTTMEVY